MVSLSPGAHTRTATPNLLSQKISHQPRKGQLADEQLGGPLVLADLAQGDRPRAVPPLAGGEGGGAALGEIGRGREGRVSERARPARAGACC